MDIKKNIYLVRHGSTSYNEKDLLQGRSDIPLSQLGFSQAEKLSESLKDREFDVLYVSPLLRARQTAEVINQHHQLDYNVVKVFSEIDMGDWEGRKYTDLQKDKAFFDEWRKNSDISVPGGESFSQVCSRAKPGVEKILNSDYKNILIVAHAAVNRGILAALTGMNVSAARLFWMKNCALSKFQVFSINGKPHVVVEFWNSLI
jgi:alpha-ribazole phosphatase